MTQYHYQRRFEMLEPVLYNGPRSIHSPALSSSMESLVFCCVFAFTIAKASRDPLNETHGAQVLCEPGYFCDGGRKELCPPGTFLWQYGESSRNSCTPCKVAARLPRVLFRVRIAERATIKWWQQRAPNPLFCIASKLECERVH